MRIKVGSDRENLWQEVQTQTNVPSYCSGSGRCGKCLVKVISGEASISVADRKHLSETEIKEGYRIGCQSRPLTECEIEVKDRREEDMQVLAVTVEQENTVVQKESRLCSIAVDIGTTTLAFALVDVSGAVIATEQMINSQRSYGADVVSRITAALKGKEAELTKCIRRDVHEGIHRLLRKKNRTLSDVTKIAIAGNTTMEQLFFGLPVEGLGSYPFTPYTKGFLRAEYPELYPEVDGFECQINLPVIGFPCIAGFVGGDITAGLFELTAAKEEEGTGEKAAGTQLFLDIGTNGELAYIAEDTIVVASTAAGPVFEGAAISSGVGCVPGAIYATKIAQDMLECKTIEGKSPVGICGSGLIEAVADMLALGLIDKEGSLSPFYQTNGYLLARTKEGREVKLTQTDIREFQMAKAAIAAGVELLTKESGHKKPGRFELAGG
ncbi:MAG: DUF4445 domain-containing protein, partial [Lachnospiraceae bacterium]|nr:DUF4445 domain-containing protein [Lachnospiraceae bacterium]